MNRKIAKCNLFIIENPTQLSLLYFRFLLNVFLMFLNESF